MGYTQRLALTIVVSIIGLGGLAILAIAHALDLQRHGQLGAGEIVAFVVAALVLVVVLFPQPLSEFIGHQRTTGTTRPQTDSDGPAGTTSSDARSSINEISEVLPDFENANIDRATTVAANADRILRTRT